MRKFFPVLFLLLSLQTAALGKEKTCTIQSPDGRLELTVTCGERIVYNVRTENERVVSSDGVALELADGRTWGLSSHVKRVQHYLLDEQVPAPFYKRSQVADRCNGLLVEFREGFALEFRLYDDGMAYRFLSRTDDEVTLRGERAPFLFPEGSTAVVPYVRDTPQQHEGLPFGEQFMQSFENTYTETSLSAMDSTRLAFLPLLVRTPGGERVCITDADLESYPGMFLRRAAADRLEGVFAPCPRRIVAGGYDRMQGVVEEYEPYIARIAARQTLPWRAMALVRNDAELAQTDLVWRLASPCRLDDISWIEPGKAAWEWWNGWGLYGVDFEAGINQRTYEYYIDFAAANGLRYVVMDDGWSADHHRPFETAGDIDLPALVAYGAERGVGLILWIGYLPFAGQMEELCAHYSKMGICGFKVDFMDRDDQLLTDFVYEAARTAARYGLLLDLHGIYKPTGVQRTYPNVINFEGVHGLEQVKWSPVEVDQVTYDVTMPFIRMMAGPVDYTQGAMRNAVRENFRPVNGEPMSQGTRCRQLAQYVVFDAPLSMLCDAPSQYEREEECLRFIAGVPTVWDQTRVLEGEVGHCIVTARRSGEVWYVGGMTGWEARTVHLDLSFLPEGTYDVELFRDGANARRIARDYRREVLTLDASEGLDVELAPGGGFAARIVKH
ncbi:glycoside hydrolase family 97 protein [Alistipes sp.]|uniref:glycoside hydrolase family 97 protein n=1 Tax=Alistipes sp. TaxID=1872444 RepID=UPI003077D0A1